MGKIKSNREIIELLKTKDTLEHIGFYTKKCSAYAGDPTELDCEIGDLYGYKDWQITNLAKELNSAIEPIIQKWVTQLGILITNSDKNTEINLL
jgi:hypothetical protein